MQNWDNDHSAGEIARFYLNWAVICLENEIHFAAKKAWDKDI